MSAATDAQAHAHRAAGSEPVGWAARAGLVARGANYVIIAGLALALALGAGGKATNQQGALRTLVQVPFGRVLLIAMAIGLAGYALWRLTRAIIGHGREESDSAKERVSALGAAIGYGALCLTAVKILAGSGGSSGHPDKAASGVLGWPGGPWLVGIVALIVGIVAVDQAWTAFQCKFLEHSRTEEMTRGVQRSFTALGVFGVLARAVVFALVGWFLMKAAIEFKPHAAVGLDGALAKLRQADYGPVLLAAVAAGLLGFGLYSIVDARYARV